MEERIIPNDELAITKMIGIGTEEELEMVKKYCESIGLKEKAEELNEY